MIRGASSESDLPLIARVKKPVVSRSQGKIQYLGLVWRWTRQPAVSTGMVFRYPVPLGWCVDISMSLCLQSQYPTAPRRSLLISGSNTRNEAAIPVTQVATPAMLAAMTEKVVEASISRRPRALVSPTVAPSGRQHDTVCVIGGHF